MSLSTLIKLVVITVTVTTPIVTAIVKWLADTAAARGLANLEAKNATALTRLENELNRVNLQVKARLDHAVTVSRAQWEVELAALRNVWECVVRVRASAGAIVPGTAPEDETQESKEKRFFEARTAFIQAHHELVRGIDNNSPFYPEDIYALLDRFRTHTTGQKLQLETRTPPFFPNPRRGENGDWYDDRRKASTRIHDEAEVVSTAIRRRLASVAIRE